MDQPGDVTHAIERFAAVLFVIAGCAPSGRDIELANENHGASIEAPQLEARALQAQVSGAVQHPLSMLVPVLVPLVAIVAKNLRTTAEKSAATSAEAGS
ncbi:hypothetical protein ABIA96_006098 [Bradyrhizobium sp. LB11.1]